jgi:predicted negative regulator of RcsB-dependent stress response
MIRKNPAKVSKQALDKLVRWCLKNPKKAIGVMGVLAYAGVHGAQGVGAAARGHGAAARYAGMVSLVNAKQLGDNVLTKLNICSGTTSNEHQYSVYSSVDTCSEQLEYDAHESLDDDSVATV